MYREWAPGAKSLSLVRIIINDYSLEILMGGIEILITAREMTMEFGPLLFQKILMAPFQ